MPYTSPPLTTRHALLAGIEVSAPVGVITVVWFWSAGSDV